MRKLIAMFAVAGMISFTSCSKEAETAEEAPVEVVEEPTVEEEVVEEGAIEEMESDSTATDSIQ